MLVTTALPLHRNILNLYWILLMLLVWMKLMILMLMSVLTFMTMMILIMILMMILTMILMMILLEKETPREIPTSTGGRGKKLWEATYGP